MDKCDAKEDKTFGQRTVTKFKQSSTVKPIFSLWRHPGTHYIGLNLLVLMLYMAGIKISDIFVSDLIGGRITPIWFPSALTLGLFFHFGSKVIPGITIGSIMGLISVMETFTPPISIAQFLVLETAFALANTIQPFVANFWIKKNLALVLPKSSKLPSPHQSSLIDPLSCINPFEHIQTTLSFVQAALLTPMISAVIGVGALSLLGIVTPDKLVESWLTWWLASALAHIVFTPVLIGARFHRYHRRLFKGKSLLFILSGTAIIFLAFNQNYPIAYLLLPLILMVGFSLGGFIANLAVAIIAIVTVCLTVVGGGIFAQMVPSEDFMGDLQLNNIIFLQLFMGLLSVTSLVFSAMMQERKVAQHTLKEVIDNLEETVQKRTNQLLKVQLELQESNHKLAKLAQIDCLTQIANRRYFDQKLDQEWQRLCQENKPLSLIFLDVDYFKLYNDYYGHGQGDICLAQISHLLQQVIRKSNSDFPARYGGEEFVLLLSGADRSSAIAVAERIQVACRNLAIPHEAPGAKGKITISMGIATAIPRMTDDPSNLLKKADKAMYQAKQGGRDQFKFFDDDHSTPV